MLRLLIITVAFAFSGTARAQQYDWQDYQDELNWSAELAYAASDFADLLSDRWLIAQEGYLLEAGDVTEDEAVAEMTEIIEQREQMYVGFTGLFERLLENKPATGETVIDEQIDAIVAATEAFLTEAEQAFALDALMAEHFRALPEELVRQDFAAELRTDQAAAEVYLADRRLWLLFSYDQQFLHRAIRTNIAFTESYNRVRGIEAAFQTGNADQIPELAAELRDHAQRMHRLAGRYAQFASATAARWQSELEAGVERPGHHRASIALAEAYVGLFEAHENAGPLLMEMMAASQQARDLEDFQSRVERPATAFIQVFSEITQNSIAVDDAQARLDALFE
jgi:hypothetical protein